MTVVLPSGEGGPGSYILTVNIYRLLLGVDEGMTAAEIHDALKGPAWQSSVASRWLQRNRADTLPEDFDVEAEGFEQVRQRVRKMTERGVLVSASYKGGPGGGGVARYTADPDRPPKRFRRKPTGLGWRDIDVAAEEAAARLGTARLIWAQTVDAELRRSRPRPAKIRELLVKGRELMLDHGQDDD